MTLRTRSLSALLLPAALVVGLSACSSSRPDRYPGGRTVPTPDGNVIVMDDGRVYRDRDRNGVPDVYEGRDGRNGTYGNGRTAVCHRGRTVVVAGNAVRAHVNHGDYVGACRPNRTADRNRRVERDDDDRRERGRQVRNRDDDDRRERGNRQNRNRGNGRDRDDD